VKTGATPLYIASQNGHSDIVNILIRNGADINLARNTGATPLYIASQNGHSDVVNTNKEWS
jgi:ankyrin repeat protein